MPIAWDIVAAQFGGVDHSSDSTLGIVDCRNPGRDQYPALHHPQQIQHYHSAGTHHPVSVTPQLDHRLKGGIDGGVEIFVYYAVAYGITDGLIPR
jgi:hypothetical protein